MLWANAGVELSRVDVVLLPATVVNTGYTAGQFVVTINNALR
ncbi:MAG: hypothetical protein ACJ712_07625 [Nitrososphaeraceae archaeon]